MNFLASVVLSAILSAIVTGLAVTAWSRLRGSVVGRRLWCLSKPSAVVICLAQSNLTQTGVYARRSTGIGQARALAILSAHLGRTYRDVKLENTLAADPKLGRVLEDDLIVLGGPKNNPVAKELLKRLGNRLPLTLDETGAIDKLTGNRYPPHVEGDLIRRDVGLIVRARNPYCASRGHRTSLLFAGVHTYGVIAAARYFVEEYGESRSSPKGDFAAIVQGDVHEDHVFGPKLLVFRPIADVIVSAGES